MRFNWMLAIILILAPIVSHARTYKCQTKDGIVYSDTKCGESLSVDTGGYSAYGNSGTGGAGMRQEEYSDLQEYKAKSRERKKAMSESARKTIPFNDRIRLRELRMERSDLESQLNKSNLSLGSGVVLEERLKAIRFEEEQIRAMPESARKTISFNDRIRLRELRMERSDLESQLKKSNLSLGSGIALEERLKAIRIEEGQIRSGRR